MYDINIGLLKKYVAASRSVLSSEDVERRLRHTVGELHLSQEALGDEDCPNQHRIYAYKYTDTVFKKVIHMDIFSYQLRGGRLLHNR